LKNSGKNIFVDLKMHDIPNTVAQGASMLTKMGMSMLNVHALGGAAMMKAAAEGVANTANTLNIPRPKLIAVTILTSMGNEEWDTLNYKLSISEQVVLLAKMAKDTRSPIRRTSRFARRERSRSRSPRWPASRSA
jgi:orotidine-5'-phosphate decarboxylase